MKHLNKNIYIWLLVSISALAYVSLFLLYPKGNLINIIDYIKPIPSVVLLDTVITFLFVKYFWKWRIFYSWLVPFPDINGTWKGRIKSTWVDPLTNERPEPIPVILTIKQSFTSVSCVFRTQEMESFSFISGFVINPDNQVLKLVFSYDGVPTQSVRERNSQHQGTANLNIVLSDKKNELIGEYWTGRKTTGSLELVFWKSEFVNKFPKNIGKHPVSAIRSNENNG